MPTIFKPGELEFSDNSVIPEEFKLRTLTPRLSEIANARHLIFDIRRLDPGKFSFPYHYHRNSEEMMMVISGALTLRSPEGIKVVGEGEIIFCEMGEKGAHQFYNHGSSPTTYLDLRSSVGIDVVVYPDSGKINILPYHEVFLQVSQTDYYEGEGKIHEIWNELLKNQSPPK